MRTLALIALFLVTTSLALALPGYEEPRSGFSADTQVSVTDTAVYNTGYYSADGADWHAFSLSGTTRGNWILRQATSNLDLTGVRYVAIFSCTWNTAWSCGSTWQVLDRGAQTPPGETEYSSKNSVQGDFEALRALYASTQGQGVEVLDSTDDLPTPTQAQYPYMYIIDDEIWALSKERLRRIGEWVNHGAIWKDKTGWEDMTPETMGAAAGIEVDENGRVTVVDMQKVTTAPAGGGFITTGNGLIGVLPPEIGHLKKVRHFNVKQNFFHGEVPDVFHNWTDLWRWSIGGMTWEMNLDRRIHWHESDHRLVSDDDNPFTHRSSTKQIMSTNNFRTKLPSSLDNLPNLELIEAAAQYLEGPLPAWSNLPSIRAIFIPRILGPESKKLGEIPESWGNFDTMEVFAIASSNTPRFSGELPAGMREWSNLANFQIGTNEFSGKLPLGKMDDLIYFTIGRNKFSGDFPWESIFNGKNARLSKFGISYNDFTGELPQTIPPALEPTPQVEEKYRLDHFSVLGNNFSGDLPAWVSELRGLQIINIGRNSFTGPFPSGLLNQTNLKTVYLQGNHLSGPLPDAEWKTNRIRWFYINDNHLEGEIPDSWQTLFQEDDGSWIDSTFQRYLFSGNEFTGPIPDWGKNVNWGVYEMYTFHDNKYTFKDIIDSYPELKTAFGDNFRVTPQKPFGQARTITTSGSATINDFEDIVIHPENQYQWFRNGDILSGATSNTLTTSQSGEYVLQVTNHNIPDLVLYSQPIIVIQ